MMAGCLTPGDVIQIIVAVVTAGGIICAFLMNRKQLGIYNKQLKQSFFAEYTRRYQEIILNFPENINDDGFDYDALESGTKDKVLRYMRVYFDLCSEEYHLHCDGSLEEDVWLNWQEGILWAMSRKAFREAWERVGKGTYYNGDFGRWMEGIAHGGGE